MKGAQTNACLIIRFLIFCLLVQRIDNAKLLWYLFPEENIWNELDNNWFNVPTNFTQITEKLGTVIILRWRNIKIIWTCHIPMSISTPH